MTRLAIPRAIMTELIASTDKANPPMRPSDPPIRDLIQLIIIKITTIVTSTGRFFCNLSARSAIHL